MKQTEFNIPTSLSSINQMVVLQGGKTQRVAAS